MSDLHSRMGIWIEECASQDHAALLLRQLAERAVWAIRECNDRESRKRKQIADLAKDCIAILSLESVGLEPLPPESR